ncbi:16S rRNA (guanine(527)-N(7))-methyltransferase RsmG [Pseudanabaena sp. FACHB-2040]|uniref:16S rRNA (guanine(527)-N(7))-methyltransferase RsmG n=1 Tax=Pseudanabaena sp. FACHB-2040 TaxID=2692859 RepID=UPI0016870EC1|nr:16S rRNA (guanine(527)-N(7))-methyltransferase RsmG [Pseudanabaena sp. FACHB-2040]MBD2259684.1 16S rRNA (guanine(527)-N(7))-methyltransferase RsmG [Pseudanabaena sp. FACHB-2040]
MTTAFSSLPTLGDTWQKTLQWQPDKSQRALFQKLYKGILQGNQQFNLTRITAPEEFWEKHLWDSLLGIAPWLPTAEPSEIAVPPVQRVIDIGTGGGFPGLPVAIAQPTWQITCLDSTRKKIAFLAELSQSLGLDQVQTAADRAESFGRHPAQRESYDLALIRAVGPVTVCAEYALPLVKVNGVAVLYRGQWTAAEASALGEAAARLGGGDIEVQAATTPLTQGVRHCLYIRKQSSTPVEFPRAPGTPAKQPLG